MRSGSAPPLRPLLGLTFALAALLLAILGGCGGGGGGPAASVRARLDLSAVPGRSVRLRVFDASGNQTAGSIVDASGTVSLALSGAGEVRVLAEEFSAPGGGGTILGSAEAYVVASPTASVAFSPGAAPTGVLVSPAAATLPTGGGRRFAAALVAADGALTFTADAFAFEALGGVATVTPAGIVSAVAAGTGSIRATHSATGLSGAAALTVTPATTQRSKWTVLVYMNAANDLYTFSPLNVNQMERVAGSPANVRFVVQWKLSRTVASDALFDGTRRYLVRPDSTDAIASTLVQDLGPRVDMGSAATLNDFIRWGKANYPSDRLVVIVWNHGNGWRRSRLDAGRAVSYDDELNTSIQTWELSAALAGAQTDILSWDSSLMQMLEVGYEVRDEARYIVGSEESPPGEGLPYDLVFAPFRDNPDRSTLDLTKAFVDGMLAAPGYSTRKITQSSLDTTKLASLTQAVDALGAALIANAAEVAPIIPAIRNAAQAYSQSGARTYRDLYDVCLRLEATSTNPTVLNASRAVRAAISAAVVQEGHNANSPNSRGISIDFSAGTTFAPSATDYGRLRFAQDSRWDEFLIQAP